MSEEKYTAYGYLSKVDVSDHTEKKNGLTYLSWSWAWGYVKNLYPDTTFTVYENVLPSGYTVNYFTDGKTCWVKTGVTIQGLEYIEELPVMDYKNRSISFDAVTSMDVNKAIQRSLTKAIARHGLGLNIYAGEDLPMDANEVKEEPAPEKKAKAEKKIKEKVEEAIKYATPDQLSYISENFELEVLDKLIQHFKVNSIKEFTEAQAQQIIDKRKRQLEGGNENASN